MRTLICAMFSIAAYAITALIIGVVSYMVNESVSETFQGFLMFVGNIAIYMCC